MQSNLGRGYTSIKHIAPAERRSEGTDGTLKAAMKAWTGAVILLLLFVASLEYVVFGGAYAVESAPEVITSNSALAEKPADVGSPAPSENQSDRSAQPAGYFPSAYPDRGREGEGNVATYEHD